MGSFIPIYKGTSSGAPISGFGATFYTPFALYGTFAYNDIGLGYSIAFQEGVDVAVPSVSGGGFLVEPGLASSIAFAYNFISPLTLDFPDNVEKRTSRIIEDVIGTGIAINGGERIDLTLSNNVIQGVSRRGDLTGVNVIGTSLPFAAQLGFAPQFVMAGNLFQGAGEPFLNVKRENELGASLAYLSMGANALFLAQNNWMFGEAAIGLSSEIKGVDSISPLGLFQMFGGANLQAFFIDNIVSMYSAPLLCDYTKEYFGLSKHTVKEAFVPESLMTFFAGAGVQGVFENSLFRGGETTNLASEAYGMFMNVGNSSSINFGATTLFSPAIFVSGSSEVRSDNFPTIGLEAYLGAYTSFGEIKYVPLTNPIIDEKIPR